MIASCKSKERWSVLYFEEERKKMTWGKQGVCLKCGGANCGGGEEVRGDSEVGSVLG